MKMMIIVCPENRCKEVRELINTLQVTSYSEISNVLGAGKTGPHLDTRLFPGKSALIFTVVPASKTKELTEALKNYQAQLLAGEGLRVFALPVEAVL